MARKLRPAVRIRIRQKINHSAGLARRISKERPSNKKAMARLISERNSAKPIFLPHFRHFPFRKSQEKIGILSYHFNLYLQERQTEREPRGLDFLVLS